MGQKVQNKEIQLAETDQEAQNLKEKKGQVSQPNQENKLPEQQENQVMETQTTDKAVSCPRCLYKNQFKEDHVQCKCKLDFCVHCKYDINADLGDMLCIMEIVLQQQTSNNQYRLFYKTAKKLRQAPWICMILTTIVLLIMMTPIFITIVAPLFWLWSRCISHITNAWICKNVALRVLMLFTSIILIILYYPAALGFSLSVFIIQTIMYLSKCYNNNGKFIILVCYLCPLEPILQNSPHLPTLENKA